MELEMDFVYDVKLVFTPLVGYLRLSGSNTSVNILNNSSFTCESNVDEYKVIVKVV